MVRAMFVGKLKALAATAMLLVSVIVMSFGWAAHQAELASSLDAKAGGDPPQAREANDPPNTETRPSLPVDHYGDLLPPGAISRLGSVRLFPGDGHGTIRRVTLAPDGKQVVSECANGNRLWDAVTGKELSLAGDLRGAKFFAALGRLMAVDYRDGLVRILDLATEQELDRLTPGQGAETFALSANGRTLAWTGPHRRGADGLPVHAIFLYDVPARKLAEPLDYSRGLPARRPEVLEQVSRAYVVYALALSADGQTLAAQFHDDSVAVWDLQTRARKLATPSGIPRLSGRMALSPDGSILATAAPPNEEIQRHPSGVIQSPPAERKIQLWNTRTGKELAALVIQPRQRWAPADLVFAPDSGHLAAACEHALCV
jgi:WD40 repeat protein